MNLEITAMEEYLTFPMFPELEPDYQIQFSVIPRTPFLVN